jgi:hypothetical protein
VYKFLNSCDRIAGVKLNLKQGLIYLALAFVIMNIWNDPNSSSDSMGSFLGDTGDFFAQALDKGAEFFGDLVN